MVEIWIERHFHLRHKRFISHFDPSALKFSLVTTIFKESLVLHDHIRHELSTPPHREHIVRNFSVLFQMIVIILEQ